MLRDYQLEVVKTILHKKKQHAFLCLPRRSGKSFLNLYIANASICINYDKIFHVIIFCKEKGQARAIFSKNVMDNGKSLFNILHPKAVYSPYTSEITYPNGSTISFAGSDNMETERGKRGSLLILDEYATYKYPIEAFYPFLQDQRKDTIIVSSTPRGKNHYYDLKLYAEKNDNWFVTHKSVVDLELMTQKEVDDLPGDKNFIAQEYMSSFESSNAGAIYPTPCVQQNIEIQHNLPIYCGIDLGRMHDATAFVFCQVINEKIFIVYAKEYEGEIFGNIIADLKYNLKLLGIDYQNVQYFLPHDSEIRNEITGLSRTDMFRQYGFNCSMSPMKSVLEGIDLVRSVWTNIVWCETKSFDAIESIKKYVRGIDGKPDTSKSLHKFTNTADGLRYLMVKLENNRIIKSWKERIDITINKYKRYHR
ncbi:MAG: hypothetical protein IPP65_13230 [Chlorobi bacterium]|nr:hypothetical protein [Chlorobiota bacterium]